MKLRMLTVLVATLMTAACNRQEAAPAAAGTAAAPAAEEKVLNVYNWSDYIAPDTIKKFQDETGIKVTYDVMDSNETLETKVLAGDTGYDIVVPSSSFLGNQIKAGAYRELDRAQLPNWKNLDTGLMAKLTDVDPGNKHAISHRAAAFEKFVAWVETRKSR